MVADLESKRMELSAIRQSGFEISNYCVSPTSLVPKLCRRRAKPNGFVKIVKRVGKISLLFVSRGTICVGTCISWVRTNCRVKVLYGAGP